MARTILAVALVAVSLSAQATEARSDRVKVPSKASGSPVSAVVHLPPGYEENGQARYPVIYFLHGAGRGNENTWVTRGTPRTVARLVAAGKLPPCIVVCPRARRMSFWINWKGQEGQRHGDFVTQELPAWVDATYRTRKGRESRALMGDSMGGFGALVNALRNPAVFGSVSAIAPAIYPEDRNELPSWMRGGGGGRGGLLTRLFGDPIDDRWWLTHNVFHLAKTAKPGAFDELAIFFDVGTRDRYGLDVHCKAWHGLLDKQKVAHTFQLRDGGHGREFFSDNVEHALAFHGASFAKPAGKSTR